MSTGAKVFFALYIAASLVREHLYRLGRNGNVVFLVRPLPGKKITSFAVDPVDVASAYRP